LVGFVNLVWDGGTHAFVLDTVVAVNERRHGVGIKLVAQAECGARSQMRLAARRLRGAAAAVLLEHLRI
jgi:hypothetical protein